MVDQIHPALSSQCSPRLFSNVWQISNGKIIYGVEESTNAEINFSVDLMTMSGRSSEFNNMLEMSTDNERMLSRFMPIITVDPSSMRASSWPPKIKLGGILWFVSFSTCHQLNFEEWFTAELTFVDTLCETPCPTWNPHVRLQGSKKRE